MAYPYTNPPVQPNGQGMLNRPPTVPIAPPIISPPIAGAAPVAAAVAAAPPLLVLGALIGGLKIIEAGVAYADLQTALKNEAIAKDNAAKVASRPVNTGAKVTQGTPPFKGGQTKSVYYDVSFTRTRGDGLVTRFSRPLGNGDGNWVYGVVKGIRIDTPAPNSGQVMRLIIIDRDGERSMGMTSGNIAYNPENPSSIYTFSDISFDLFTYPNQSDTGGDPPPMGGGDPLPDGYNGDRTREQRPKVPPPQIPNRSPNGFRPTINGSALGIGTEVPTKVRTGTPSDNQEPRKSLAPSPVRTPSPTPTTPKAPNQSPDKSKEKEKAPFIPPSPDKKIDDIAQNLLGLIPIVGLINANTQPDAQRTNAKNGSCDALNSPSCREGLKNDIVNPLGQKIDKNAIGQDVALGKIIVEQEAQKGVLAAIALKAKDIFDLIGKLWNNTLVDKAVGYITMITAMHNAAMLSRSIGDTLASAIDNGLIAMNLGIKDKDGSTIGVNQAIGKSIQQLIRGAIGNAAYENINNTWVQANRVYQTGINLLSNVQSIIDSSTAVAELTNNRLGTLMNALRNSGTVRENAYGAQSQNVTKFNAFENKLQALEQGVSNTASITGNIVSVQQSVNELKNNRTEFDNALKNKPQGTGLTENDAEKTAREGKKEQSLYTIGDFSIVKPPETP